MTAGSVEVVGQQDKELLTELAKKFLGSVVGEIEFEAEDDGVLLRAECAVQERLVPRSLLYRQGPNGWYCARSYSR